MKPVGREKRNPCSWREEGAGCNRAGTEHVALPCEDGAKNEGKGEVCEVGASGLQKAAHPECKAVTHSQASAKGQTKQQG